MENIFPLISVVLPIYNVESCLRRCIDSVISQTYKNIEIILVDDGSPDNCPKICDEYEKIDSRIKVIHQQNGGLSAARNAGLGISSGQFIAFIDSDDYVSNDYLFFMYDLIDKYDADIASCGAMEVYPSGRSSPQSYDRSIHVMDSREALERMCYNEGFFVTTWDKLYRRSLFEHISFPEGKLFEDTGTTYKLVDRARIIVSCCEVKYYYVISGSSTSITTSAFKMSKLDYVEMADEMADYITEKYPDLKSAADRKRMHACLSTLTQLVNSNVRKPEVERLLTDRIRSLKKEALKNPRTPKRDKAALLALSFGYSAFSVLWRLYLKIKKGL